MTGISARGTDLGGALRLTWSPASWRTYSSTARPARPAAPGPAWIRRRMGRRRVRWRQREATRGIGGSAAARGSFRA
jgi:hypothetical protein